MNANAEIIAELRRVLNERDEAREQLDLTKRELGRWVDREAKAVRERDEARAACPDCAMYAERSARFAEQADRLQSERDEARAEVERLRIALLEVQTSESAAAWFADGFHDGWKAGAEAMREACAREIVEGRQNSHEGMMQWFEDIASDVRDLPIPEEP